MRSAFLALASLAIAPAALTAEIGTPRSTTVARPAAGPNTSVTATFNAQEAAKANLSASMNRGFQAEVSGAWPLDPGSSELRVRPTTEQPVPSTSGAFRTVCGVSAIAFNDPIVYWGEPWKSHLHTFVGNTGIDAFSTADTLRASGNSTCRGGIFNRSAYWVPSLLDMRTMRPVLPETFLIYYKSGDFNTKGGADGRIVKGVFVPWQPPVRFQDMPKGLRMVAGDPSRSTPLASSDEFAHRWKCSGADAKYSSSIPDCAVGTVLYQEVFFPQCWDGKNLDSPDHKSHMSYGVHVANAGDPRGWTHRECPATHPVVLPKVSFEIAFPVTQTTKHWRLVSDSYAMTKPAGYSSHGDWFGAWSAQPWRAGCVSANKDCHAHLLGDGRELY